MWELHQSQIRLVESLFAQNKGFPYHGDMNVTLSLDDELVKKVRKIAVDRDTTLTGMIREYLQRVAQEDSASAAERKRQQIEVLKRSFDKYPIRVGKITWKRADLYERGRR